jgi:electron-transferring-flavoprotein dehydrogenase
VFAEGCRGSLTQKVIEKFNLSDGSDPQTYGIGLK